MIGFSWFSHWIGSQVTGLHVAVNEMVTEISLSAIGSSVHQLGDKNWLLQLCRLEYKVWAILYQEVIFRNTLIALVLDILERSQCSCGIRSIIPLNRPHMKTYRSSMKPCQSMMLQEKVSVRIRECCHPETYATSSLMGPGEDYGSSYVCYLIHL
jgi:hypothetical protein